MKLLKSECGKAWLFDVTKDEYFLLAGFACFMPGCSSIASFLIDGKTTKAIVPAEVAISAVPLRMLNARLALQ